jgi:uncharacterized protein YecT (DUF1311 family)
MRQRSYRARAGGAGALLLLCVCLPISGVATMNSAAEDRECGQADTTAEMLKCFRQALATAEQKLTTLRGRLKHQLSPEEWEPFSNADAAWLAYRKANCISAAALYRGGSMEQVVALACTVEMTRERARELRVLSKDALSRP